MNEQKKTMKISLKTFIFISIIIMMITILTIAVIFYNKSNNTSRKYKYTLDTYNHLSEKEVKDYVLKELKNKYNNEFIIINYSKEELQDEIRTKKYNISSIKLTDCGAYQYVFNIIDENGIAFNVIYKDAYYRDDIYIESYFYDNYEDLIGFNQIEVLKEVKNISYNFFKEKDIQIEQIYYIPNQIYVLDYNPTQRPNKVFVDLVIITAEVSEQDKNRVEELNSKLYEYYKNSVYSSSDNFNKGIDINYLKPIEEKFEEAKSAGKFHPKIKNYIEYKFSSFNITLNGQYPDFKKLNPM
ncbi:MAG: hypothetical protein IJN50_03305 [Clostridia bacterium]|nr:hypothetical protein [Clostridia bacterium]